MEIAIAIEVLFKIYFVMICLDFISGIASSAKEGKLKSRTCSDGMFRSIGECIVLCIFIVINHYVPSINSFLCTFILGFIFKEGLSIVENLIRLDVWVPNSIKKALEVGVDKIDKLNN